MGDAINHTERKHALLSASGASRWMNCTASARLEEGFQETASDYAAEGTLAHEFAELGLRAALSLIDPMDYPDLISALRDNDLYSDEMEEEVQKHIDYVLEQFTEAQRLTEGAILLIEEKTDLTYFIENGFGTCDVVIIADGVLEVIDLKYGKGVRVQAADNSQLKLYGLGALRAFELMYDIHTVRLTITQPRLDSISSWEITAEALNTWGEEVVKPKAKEAYAGEGEQVTGDWCRFCKAKARCKALAKESLEIARLEFSDPMLLDDSELLEAYGQADRIIDWLNGVGAYVLAEANKGKKWEGYKLVKGRSNRIWSSAEKVEALLLKDGFKKEDILISKLAGIGAIEKLTGKAKFETLLSPVVMKPPGKPTLVPESDKRPALGVEQAKTDFAD